MTSRKRTSRCWTNYRCVKLYVVTTAVACIVYLCTIIDVINVARRSTLPSPTTTTTTTATVDYYSLANEIAARADQDRYILLTMVDEAYVDMAINLYEASLRPHHIDNYLFVGVGNSTCEQLHRQSIACFYYVDYPSAGHISAYGHPDFIRKMNFRTYMILEALDANFTVVHTDVDVIFLGNPLHEIKVPADCFVIVSR